MKRCTIYSIPSSSPLPLATFCPPAFLPAFLYYVVQSPPRYSTGHHFQTTSGMAVGYRYTFFFLGECHSVHCQYSFASSGFSSWGAAVRSLKVMNFLCKLNKFLWKPCRPDRKGMRWDSLLCVCVCVLLSTESDGKWVYWCYTPTVAIWSQRRSWTFSPRIYGNVFENALSYHSLK